MTTAKRLWTLVDKERIIVGGRSYRLKEMVRMDAEKEIRNLKREVAMLSKMLEAFAQGIVDRLLTMAQFDDLSVRHIALVSLMVSGIVDALRVYGIDIDDYIPPPEVAKGIINREYEKPSDIPDYRHPDYEPGSKDNSPLIKSTIPEDAAADIIDIENLLDDIDFDGITPEDIIGDDLDDLD